MSLEWIKHPLNQSLARELRAATRRKPQIDGHGFSFGDLKELWSAAEVHAVLTHEEDQTWQVWFNAPEGGWKPTAICESREQALDAAHQNVNLEDAAVTPGTFLLFRFDDSRPWTRVPVHSESGVETLTGIYTRMGCETQIERVS